MEFKFSEKWHQTFVRILCNILGVYFIDKSSAFK